MLNLLKTYAYRPKKEKEEFKGETHTELKERKKKFKQVSCKIAFHKTKQNKMCINSHPENIRECLGAYVGLHTCCFSHASTLRYNGGGASKSTNQKINNIAIFNDLYFHNFLSDLF